MAEEVEKLAKRVDALENKLRMTFMEVERRFNILREKHKEHDLVTKIKDTAGLSVDIGLTPDTPPLAERLNRLEHEVSIIGNRGFTEPQEKEVEVKVQEDVFDTPPVLSDDFRHEDHGSHADHTNHVNHDSRPHNSKQQSAGDDIIDQFVKAVDKHDKEMEKKKIKTKPRQEQNTHLLEDVNKILGIEAHV